MMSYRSTLGSQAADARPQAPAYSGSLGAPQAAQPSGGFYDPSKVAGALSGMQAGADGRKMLDSAGLLSIMNPIAAPRWYDPSAASGSTTHMERDNGGDYQTVNNDPGYFISSNGTRLASADGKTFTDTYDNPTGNGKRDQADVTYTIDPTTGLAMPVSASPRYKPSGWVDTGRDLAKWAAVMATAGTAGAYMGAGTAAEGSAVVGGGGGMSSADLAALHSASGYGASTSAEAGFAGLGGTTAGGSAGLTSAELAGLPGAYGSAPAYGGMGSPGAGAGTDAVVNGSSGTGSLGSYAKDAYKAYQTYNSMSGKGGSAGGDSSMGGALGAVAGAGGLSNGDRYRQQLMGQALRDNVQQQPQQQMPGWIQGAS